MRKPRLEKFRNILLIIAIFSSFLSSLYFFLRIKNYPIAIGFLMASVLLMMLSISQRKK